MNRLVCLAVLLGAPSAHADDRQTVAVLGVVPREAGLTKAADAVTGVLRAQAARKTSEYRVTGTPKEVDTAVLAGECSTIQPACAAKLGAQLGADYALAGELERRGTHQVLLLSLVDVTAKQRIRSVRQVVATGSDAKKLARAAYTRLTGGDVGELAVVANAQRGEVLIDGTIVGALYDGRVTIGGLVKGNHLLTVRSPGYRPVEVDLTVGTSTKQMVLLDPEPAE